MDLWTDAHTHTHTHTHIYPTVPNHSTHRSSSPPLESTCGSAFISCNDDPTCRLRLAEAVNSCTWNKVTNRCDRAGCLAAIRRFYLLTRPEKTHALLFCRCKLGDRKCETVQAAMFPTCSVMEEPPPSCLDVLQRCYADEDCRWVELEWKQWWVLL